MKACLQCERIAIRTHYSRLSPIRVFFALPFIYSPILLFPFILLSGGLVYLHLRLIGAHGLKNLGHFLPARETHRYNLKTQIVKRGTPKLAFWTHSRLYWIFNCTWYCPTSVALLEWHSYLVKAVENFWCPFAHAKKPHYANASLDGSYWHDEANESQLHPQDRYNIIWNAHTPLNSRTPLKTKSA